MQAFNANFKKLSKKVIVQDSISLVSMCKGLKKCDLQSEIAGKEAEEMEPLMSSTKLGDGEWDDGDTGADNQDNNFQIIKLLVGEWSLYLDKR